MKDNGLSIDIPRVTNKDYVRKAPTYGAYTSELKEKYFVRQYMIEHMWLGYVTIFPLEEVHHLKDL